MPCYINDRISLAEAHCKLCLRTTVQEEDSLVAVLLCENAITLRHGRTMCRSGKTLGHFNGIVVVNTENLGDTWYS